jgi:hypothetical protein
MLIICQYFKMTKGNNMQHLFIKCISTLDHENSNQMLNKGRIESGDSTK